MRATAAGALASCRGARRKGVCERAQGRSGRPFACLPALPYSHASIRRQAPAAAQWAAASALPVLVANRGSQVRVHTSCLTCRTPPQQPRQLPAFYLPRQDKTLILRSLAIRAANQARPFREWQARRPGRQAQGGVLLEGSRSKSAGAPVLAGTAGPARGQRLGGVGWEPAGPPSSSRPGRASGPDCFTS